jgi:hypothetical protein
MQLCAGHIVELVDADQQQLGHVQIMRQEAALLFGTFQPGAAFRRVAQLFRDFEAAVDVQALHAIETLDTTIAALGLHLRDPGTLESLAIVDVQIWSDGGMTCRLGGESLAPTPVPQYSVLANGMQKSRSAEPRPGADGE